MTIDKSCLFPTQMATTTSLVVLFSFLIYLLIDFPTYLL